MVRPGEFKLYKGIGAAKFTLLKPQYKNGYLSKAGAVLLEAAPSSGDQEWDWQRKISFAISIQDVCNLLDRDERKRRIFHEHNESPKTLEFRPGTGKHEGTFMLQLNEGKGQDRKGVSVPISNGEWQVLIRLLLSACPQMIGWEGTSDL